MSIEVEMNNKGGKVCEQARCGAIKCPLIVRPTSEDVLTGNVFGMLKHIRPHLWLNPMLNQAIDGDPNSGRFRQVWFKGFTIQFWKRQPRFPPELLEFREGRTEPDVIVEWENPPTTLWIEAKFTSPLAVKTTNSNNNDQVIRGIRTLLHATGHSSRRQLFARPKRVPMWLGLLMSTPDPLVERYRCARKLQQALGGGVNGDLPNRPIHGALTWKDVINLATNNWSKMSTSEKYMLATIAPYIDYKLFK